MRRLKGSIVRHGDGWRCMATVHDAEGNAKRVSKVVHGGRKEAERVLAELVALDELRRAVDFSRILDAYLADCRRRVRLGELEPRTVREYEAHIETRIRPALGRFREPTPMQVRRFLEGLERNRTSVHKTLRQVCNFAERRDMIRENPMRRIEAPAAPRLATREDVYSKDEVQAVMAALGGEPDWFRCAVAIAIGCGLRRGEICGLDWEDYDGARISVSKAYGKATPKTANGVRVVSVPSFARAVLDSVAGSGALVAIDGVRVNPDTLTHRWERFTASRGLRRIQFRNLRHTSLTLAYEATGDIYAVSRRAGHAGIGITTRYYARPDQRIDDALGDALGNTLGM